MTVDVEIAGLGQVSRLGTELEQFWQGLMRVEHEPDPTPLGAYPFSAKTYRLPPGLCEPGPGSSRLLGYALHAANAAIADAGLDTALGRRVACILGTAMGAGIYGAAAPTDDDQGFELAVEVAEALGCRGPAQTVSTACSAGLYALSLGAGLIRSGEVDLAIVGGVETICRVALGCFKRLEALDDERCRPFDADRSGAVMGEGAAILVLESSAHRRARGRDRVYGRVLGEGWSCDGYHATRPEPGGLRLRLAAKRALAQAGLDPRDIGGVFAHGTGTRHNDRGEGLMLEALLGERCSEVPVAGIKGQLGHGAGVADRKSVV